MKVMRLIAALSLMLLIAGACAGDGGGDAAETPQDAEVEDSDEPPDSVTVLTQGEGFSPPFPEVAAGGSVEFTNEDDVRHNITVEGTDIDVTAEPGSTETIDLGDLEPGFYPFHCSIYGMSGKLTIR